MVKIMTVVCRVPVELIQKFERDGLSIRDGFNKILDCWDHIPSNVPKYPHEPSPVEQLSKTTLDSIKSEINHIRKSLDSIRMNGVEIDEEERKKIAAANSLFMIKYLFAYTKSNTSNPGSATINFQMSNDMKDKAKQLIGEEN